MKIPDIGLKKVDPLIAAAASVAAIFVFLCVTAYGPLMKRANVMRAECRSYERRIDDARRLIESVGKSCGDRILMAERDSAIAIDELTKHGKEMGVDLISMIPGEIMADPGGQYKTLSIDMEIEGRDEKLSNFLGSLDMLKKNIIKVNSFDIVANKSDRSRLRVRLALEIYLSAK